MKIVVLLKEVPDTYGDRKLSLETGLAERDASEKVLDEIGERALEVALAYADKNAGTEVVVLSAAPEESAATVRKGLAMGAARAIHIADPALAGADLGLTAEALAAALRAEGADLVITGNQSTDGSGGVMASWLGELLQLPVAPNLATVEITESGVSGDRPIDGAATRISVPLPAVISITEALPDARFPNFKGIMAAKKKPFEQRTLADLGVNAEDPAAARSIMLTVAAKPPREAGIKIVDEGDAGTKLAEFLIQNRLA
ncbi:electron transfer flavoprotein subunit beta/FixA family protein [uncultured Microbacterium sp.]|uniref:electron transfer flavoprotein subunit beta/FixA family protein n=1 Tax=uncultured Microbacterium sp. TaxID=191216 RepID=UPI0025FBB578|nr:electron transfer flavoprotein subunit beta/FixA family protein [uncultured Microbacterium sp.]